MTNTARATQLKLVPDEWARIWKQTLIEHKYDIEQALLFVEKAVVFTELVLVKKLPFAGSNKYL